jgi:hypothetical protein
MVPKTVMSLRQDHRFFSQRELPHQELASVLREFETLVAEISGATLRSAAYEGRKDKNYKFDRHLFAPTYESVFRKVNALLDQIKAVIDDLGEFEGLFRSETLSVLAHWANQHPQIRETFVLRGRGIACENPPRGPVALPTDFAMPSLDSLEKFRTAVNSTELLSG